MTTTRTEPCIRIRDHTVSNLIPGTRIIPEMGLYIAIQSGKDQKNSKRVQKTALPTDQGREHLCKIAY